MYKIFALVIANSLLALALNGQVAPDEIRVICEAGGGSTFTYVDCKRIKQDNYTGNGWYGSSFNQKGQVTDITFGVSVLRFKGTQNAFESGLFITGVSAFCERDVSWNNPYSEYNSYDTHILRYRYYTADIPLLLHISPDKKNLFNFSAGVTPSLTLINSSRWFYTEYREYQEQDTSGNWYVVHSENTSNVKVPLTGFNLAATVKVGFPVFPINGNWIRLNAGINIYQFSGAKVELAGSNVMRLVHTNVFIRLSYRFPTLPEYNPIQVKQSE